MPEAAMHAHEWRATLTRGLVAAVGFALLLSLLGFTPTRAADLSSQIAAARRSQIYHESVMRAQDRQLERLSRAHKMARKALRHGKRDLKAVKSRRAATRKRVKERTQRLESIRARWPEDPDEGEGEEEGKEPSKIYLERLKQAEDQLAGARKSLRRVERRTAHVYRAKMARQRRLASIRRQIRVVVSRQSAAEASLGGQIAWMTRLAQQRASEQTGLRLGPGGDSFAWPASGSITQRYGCTGFYLSPRRGSCRHFHDGLDMSSDGGTAIRSVAPGVVAYVGWNPWDSEGRAFIVVIGHPGGFHSRYGHLQPVRQVRVGQMVGKGGVIGRMGSTGMSTGVHLHVELLDRSGPVDPLAYLPPREMDQKAPAPSSSRGRKDGRSDRAGKAGARKKAAAKKRSASEKRSAHKKGSASKRRSADRDGRGAKARRDAGGRRGDRNRDAPTGQQDPDVVAAQGGPTPPWVLAWPAECQAASDAPGAWRDSLEVQEPVDASAVESDPGLGSVCQAASFESTLALARTEAAASEDERAPSSAGVLRDTPTAR